MTSSAACAQNYNHGPKPIAVAAKPIAKSMNTWTYEHLDHTHGHERSTWMEHGKKFTAARAQCAGVWPYFWR